MLLIAIFVAAAAAAGLPSTVQKCNRKDGDFRQCLPKAIESVLRLSKSPVKELHLPQLDPLEIPSLVIEAGNQAVAFQQNYKNLKISGFSTVRCSQADMNFDTDSLTIDCVSPVARMDFNYAINGKILLLPISGDGPGWIELDNLDTKVTFHLQKYEKNGQQYYKVSSTEVVLTPELIKLHLDNLFNGDKTLGDNINQVLNDNWKEVFGDVKASYEEAFGKIFGSIFDHTLARMSIGDMFGPE